MIDQKFPVNEAFFSVQGEGLHMGRAAYFVRFQGCDQKCTWCDSAGTWHPNFKPNHLEKQTALEIVQRAREVATSGAFMVLTGGEPALYRLDPLIMLARAHAFLVHIETAGHRALPRSVDWITLSPKPRSIPPLYENIQRAHEFKIIVEDEASIDEALALILPYCREKSQIWLHPEWGKRNEPAILDLISERVKANPRLRAGYQLHKLYKVDRLDPSALINISVPLGGEPSNGPSI